MSYELGRRTFLHRIGSDLDRDGMYLEVTDPADAAKVVLEVFYSDSTGAMTLTTLHSHVPIEVVQWAIATARARLPVASENHNPG